MWSKAPQSITEEVIEAEVEVPALARDSEGLLMLVAHVPS